MKNQQFVKRTVQFWKTVSHRKKESGSLGWVLFNEVPFELMSFDKRDKHGVVFILSFKTVCKIQFIFQSIKQVSTKNLEIFLVPRSWHVCTMQLNCEFKSPLWAVNATVWTMGGVFVRISRLLQMNLKMVNRKRPWIL